MCRSKPRPDRTATPTVIVITDRPKACLRHGSVTPKYSPNATERVNRTADVGVRRASIITSPGGWRGTALTGGSPHGEPAPPTPNAAPPATACGPARAPARSPWSAARPPRCDAAGYARTASLVRCFPQGVERGGPEPRHLQELAVLLNEISIHGFCFLGAGDVDLRLAPGDDVPVLQGAPEQPAGEDDDANDADPVDRCERDAVNHHATLLICARW